MNKLCILAGTVIFGYAFWYLGGLLGGGFFFNFLFSGAGSVIGVWLGWRVARRFP